MHIPIENGDFTVSIAAIQPRLLAMRKTAWRLMHRVKLHPQRPPDDDPDPMRALLRGTVDAEVVTKHQMRAAIVDAANRGGCDAHDPMPRGAKVT